MKKTIGLFAVAVCVLVSMQAQGAIISANYTFTGSSLASSDGDVNTTAVNVSSASLSTSGVSTTVGNPLPSFRFTSGDIGSSQNLNQYIQFTVTANSGYVISLAGGSLTLNIASGTSGNGVDWAIRSSVGNYASNIGAGSTTSTAFGSAVGTGTLTGTSYDNLASITFRIYAWDSKNGVGNAADGFVDNIIMNDTVSIQTVPEPINYAMALFGLVFVGGGVGRYYLGKARQTA